MTRGGFIEEPCDGKLSRTVLKTNGVGDNLVEFNYDPDQPPLVPNGFLSLGVERIFDEDLRLSYVLWEENGIIPILMLEVVSEIPNGEYSKKRNSMPNLA